MAASKTASIYTLGCRLNQSETATLEAQLADAGYALAPWGEPADLGIVHTCTVTREADAKSRKALRRFQRANPHARLAVIGCYAQMAPEVLLTINGVDLIVGSQEKLRLLDHLPESKQREPHVVRDRMDRSDFDIDIPRIPSRSRCRTSLKIQDGCDFMCSFCVIPFARGRARSRRLPNLLEEARVHVAAGAKELVLTGVNLGTYTWREHTIVDVVDTLDAIDGLQRIRISSIEPTTIPQALIERMADAHHALAPFLHIPAQSGSNRILDAMRRTYTREAFLDFVTGARVRVPGLCVGTDLMVGFPGETDRDFDATRALLDSGAVDFAHVFVYSERPGTASARLPDRVPAATAKERSAGLRDRSARNLQQLAARHVGQTVDVLFEQERAAGCWEGYTPNFLHVEVASDLPLRNQIASVRIESATNGRCAGQVVRAPATPPAATPSDGILVASGA